MLKAFIKGALGFVFPSWAVYALVGTLILGAVGTIYAKGRIDQSHKDQITALELQLDQERENGRRLAEYIARLRKAAQDDAEQKAKDDETISDLKTKLTDFIDTVPDPDRECFTESDIDGLLGIWGKGKGRSGHH